MRWLLGSRFGVVEESLTPLALLCFEREWDFLRLPDLDVWRLLVISLISRSFFELWATDMSGLVLLF